MTYRLHRWYRRRSGIKKDHAAEMASLPLRTIEALAVAIEAKGTAAPNHIRRMRVYAVEAGKELGLNDVELEAVHAAALLHDIGNLAVPEHIISKPGRLTHDEFEKVKVHPVVGSEILEAVGFPYPAASIVRSHHEKWDGSGYPDGLKGDEIPIGARILSAVDCLDALASDRPYQPAVSLDHAIETLVSEPGKSFDPVVVNVLRRRHLDFERILVRVGAGQLDSVGGANDGGGRGPLDESQDQNSRTSSDGSGQRADFLSSIASAGKKCRCCSRLRKI